MDLNIASEEVEEYDPETGGYDPTESMSNTAAIEMRYKPTPIPKSSTTVGYTPSAIKKIDTTSMYNDDDDDVTVPGKSDSEEEDVAVLNVSDLDGKDVVENIEQAYKDNLENLNSCRVQEKSAKKKGKKKKKKEKKSILENTTT